MKIVKCELINESFLLRFATSINCKLLKAELNFTYFLNYSPICDSVEQCVNEENPRCDGATFTDTSGSISHRGYDDIFNCRWEIKADKGQHVGLKFYNDFDLEWHGACGFDRLHIRCLDDKSFDDKGGKPISRLCGPKNREGDNSYAYDALKIMPKKSFFKESTSTKCNHVLLEMNTDQDIQGHTDYTGFTVG